MKEQKYWKDQASSFSRYYSNFRSFNFKICISRFLNNRTNTLMSLIGSTKNKVILDVGSGSGVHMKMIAPQCQKIIGIDFSEQMLLEARKDLNKLARRNWKLQKANAQELPFSDKHFDVVICIGLLDYVTSPKQVLSECCRVLKEKGFIIFTIPKKPSFFFFLRTPAGNLIRRKILNLPPIDNIYNLKELDKLINAVGLYPYYTKPIWTTMWITKAQKA